MARIGKADHQRILHMADVDGRKAADIAAEFGCTAANIYALLGRLRGRAGKRTEAPEPPAPAPALAPSPVDLFAAASSSKPASGTVTDMSGHRPAAPPDRGIGAKLAKPGFGLAMRTADGEESLAPFRSLDDLLTAVKPVLRSAARSPDPVWFSIQPIDLATIETDAA